MYCRWYIDGRIDLRIHRNPMGAIPIGWIDSPGLHKDIVGSGFSLIVGDIVGVRWGSPFWRAVCSAHCQQSLLQCFSWLYNSCCSWLSSSLDWKMIVKESSRRMFVSFPCSSSCWESRTTVPVTIMQIRNEQNISTSTFLLSCLVGLLTA